MFRFVFERVENIVQKEENAGSTFTNYCQKCFCSYSPDFLNLRAKLYIVQPIRSCVTIEFRKFEE